jgi:hypothetical protein
MATRRVKFIGKTPYKKDNVCCTNLYWAYPGAIVVAPEDIAIRLLSHRDVWVEAADDDEGLEIGKKPILTLDEGLSRDEKIAIAISIIETESCLIEVMAHFDSEECERDEELVESIGDGTIIDKGLADINETTETNQVPDVKDDQVPVIAFSVNRDEAIVQAILRLDRDSEEHFTKEGVPRVEAIEGLLNYDVTAAERTAGWDTIQEAEGN